MTQHPRLRRTVLALGAAALAVALAACSSTASGESTASAGTRTVSTAEGEVTVPAHPQRIVSVHAWTTESLLDMDVTPVGVENSGEQYVPTRYVPAWKKIDKIAEGGTVDLEKIAALKPDLIVGVDVPYLKDVYAKLSTIAPTAFAPFSESATFQDYPKYTAAFADTGASYEALKKKYDDRIAELRSTYASQLATVKWDVIQGGFDAGNFWIYSTGSPVGGVLESLGATFASATAGTKSGDTQSVSYERTDLLTDADAIIYYVNNDGTPANNIDKLFALPGYQSLPAVTAGHAVGTPDFLPGSYSDGLGLLDSIEKALKTFS
ncbi:iron siderophore-binding protein [Leifsonia sp. LS1]|uniref:ABC transporter substrate-binding protein n=1 Tax=Leifsonia sp. LS1 TaxID=2828483 RepID=UPI001CFCD9A0|nr:ABC transporter substrate-binding protein [Leifsonia sp. LS1]GIT79065.1 iron siderophore-binding protein [Leifsonia sp. LS1]